MEAQHYSKIWVTIYRTTQHNILEDLSSGRYLLVRWVTLHS